MFLHFYKIHICYWYPQILRQICWWSIQYIMHNFVMYFFQFVGDNKCIWEKLYCLFPIECQKNGSSIQIFPRGVIFLFAVEIISYMFISTNVTFNIYSVNKECRFQLQHNLYRKTSATPLWFECELLWGGHVIFGVVKRGIKTSCLQVLSFYVFEWINIRKCSWHICFVTHLDVVTHSKNTSRCVFQCYALWCFP